MTTLSTEAIPSTGQDIGVLSTNFDSFEPQSMEEVLSHTTVEHLQLSRGRFLGEVMRAEFTTSTLDWGSYNLPLLASAGMPADRVTLGFILTSDGESLMNGKNFSASAVVVFTESTELYYHLAPNTQWLAFQVERSLLERIGLPLQQQFAGFAGNPSPGNRRLNQNLQDTLAVLRSISGPEPSPDVPDPVACMKEAEAYLFDLLTSAFTSVQSGYANGKQHFPEAIRLARFATDYILANMAEPLRIGTICRELDCDLKSLERAFRRVHGTSPRQFLTLIRLNRARQLLLDSNGSYTVTWAATACGIQHLGRFSQQYRLWFGEHPSETLARSIHAGKKS